LKYIKEYEAYYDDWTKPKKYKKGDYVRDITSSQDTIYIILNTIDHGDGAGFPGSKTGYHYLIETSDGIPFWKAEDDLKPLSDLEIAAIKYNI